MNKIRRKSLQEIIDQIDHLRDDLDALKEEEEEYRDNMPENLQGGERYEAAENAISNMEDAVTSLEEVISSLDAAIE